MTANDAGKTYDGLAFSGGAGVGYSGFVNGETASVLGGTLTYGGSAQGAVNAGSYSLTASGLTSGNYAIAYTPGALTVAKATLLVTGARAQSRIYDGTGQAEIDGAALQGVAGADQLALSLSGARFNQAAVGAGLAVTADYAISGPAAGNYDLQTPGPLSADILARPLLVTAMAASRAYGADNPPLSYTIGGAGLLPGDSLTGALSVAATATSAAGTYPIALGTLAAPANYQISYDGSSLSVQGAPASAASNPVLPPPAGAAPLMNDSALNFTLPANDNSSATIQLLTVRGDAPAMAASPTAADQNAPAKVALCWDRNSHRLIEDRHLNEKLRCRR